MDLTERINELELRLKKEKSARIIAERNLEKKSRKLFDLSEALKQSSEQLQQLLTEKTSELEGVFSNISDAYVVMDIDGLVLRMNNPAKELLGFDVSENINLLDLVHPDYKSYTVEAFKQLFYIGSFSNYKAVILTKNNQEKTVQINASIIYDPEGKPKAAQGIVRDITEETLTKEKLNEQKSQLDIIIDNSPLGITLMEPGRTGFTKVNKAFCTMLGYSEEELMPLGIKQITHKDDHETTATYLSRLKNAEIESFSLEKKYITKDKNSIWAKTSVSAVRDEKNNIKFQIAIIEDVTSDLQTKQKVKESEERLSSLVKNLQTGVLLEDEERNVLLVNEMCCSMFEMGVTPEELEGTNLKNSAENFMDYFKDPTHFMSRMQDVLKRKVRVVGEELELADGRILERNYTPVYIEGTYKGHLWSFNDITLQKNYKDTLKSQKEKYSNIIANMNLGLLEVSNEGIVLLANQSFTDLSGYDQEELLGKSVSEVFNYQEESDRVQNFMNLGMFISEPFEVKIKTKTGKKRYWLVSGAPNFDINGEQQGFILIHLDITRQKNLEIQKERLLQNLERQNEQLNEYAHIVSHDLKSPLRNISALLSWTKEDFRNQLGEESLTNLDLMQTRIEKMDHLIENILKYSSIDSDRVDNRRIDLNTLLEEVQEMLYVPKHIEISVCKPLPEIVADATRMQQLFQNLLGNAINYSNKKDGRIEIDHTQNGSAYIFSVKDNGIGIAPEDHDKIFKIFRSLGNNDMSSGIGLSIVKKIIELYNGKIWLESEIGKGTTFYFSLKNAIVKK
ncbi:PAS domain S-box protein [Gramella sp. MAR_2010_147]|uniref:PAS domain S-box protein n=1 Tax=Gramella sp. MAR_2010_147 TaxID=1250205 RepID=UPI000879DD51|nr:PAS domain S-box protein [Gramella sp. MAR_2010_147]SDS21866.1 PAS domain S-box-containing protein [Gramella sp. MAR_2010_147]